jgi:hypothetical protein
MVAMNQPPNVRSALKDLSRCGKSANFLASSTKADANLSAGRASDNPFDSVHNLRELGNRYRTPASLVNGNRIWQQRPHAEDLAQLVELEGQ